MLSYLIVCPLMFLAGLVDSIAGGGGLISLPAFLLAGVPAHTALGTNNMASAMGTTVSTGRFLKNGYVRWKLAAFSAVLALGGSSIGAHIALFISDAVIRHMMIVVLPVVAFYIFRNRDLGEEKQREPLTRAQEFLVSGAGAFFVGIYAGFYGPGTGTFLILILTGAGRMQVKEASGMTKVINLSCNIAALVTFLANGKVLYPLGLAAGLFCIAGHYIGSGMVVSGGRKVVRPVVITVLALLFVKVVSGQ